MLGYVTAPAKHVHLTEIVDGVVQNPLQPWHLTPYRDDTVPSVDDLYLRAEDGRELSPGRGVGDDRPRRPCAGPAGAARPGAVDGPAGRALRSSASS